MPRLRDIAGGSSGTKDTRAKRVIRPVNSHVIGGGGAVASSTSTVGVPPARIPETGPWIGVEGFDFLFDTSDESNLTLGAGDTIQSWVDFSGNRTLVPGVTAPTLDTVNTLNGYNGIAFDRSVYNGFIDNSPYPFDINSSTMALFFVASIGDTASNYLTYFSDAGGNNGQGIAGSEYAATNTAKLRFSTSGSFGGATSNREGGDIPLNTPARMMFVWDGSNIIMRAEGNAETTPDPSGASIRPPAEKLTIGYRGTTTPAFGWEGIMYAMVGYFDNGIVSDASARQQVWDDLGTRFGL